MGLCNATAKNCTLWFQRQDNNRLPADPDIAGIGIVFAFIANSFVTIVVAHVSLFLGVIRRCGSNAIDGWISTTLHKVPFLRVSEERRKLWQPIMERLVMALSDQQLLVGISILIAGFASHCSISVYHFSIVFDLAWFSSNTHLASLGALQICLAERPSLRTWRVCLMLITLIGIAVATILQGHQRWYTSSNSPAHCLFNDLPGNIHGPGAKGMAIRLTLLMYGYSFAITRLYHAPALGFVFWEKPASNLQNSRTGIKHFRPPKFFISGLKACFVVLTLGPTGLVLIVARKLYTGVFICLSSMLANLCFDVAWFAYGLWNIINNRKIAAQWMDGNENAWGFGQIMAVLLLSSVILTLRDLHAEQKAKLGNGNASQPAIPNSDLQQPHDQTRDVHTTPSNHELDSEEPEPAVLSPTRVDTESGGRGGANTFSLQARCLKQALEERMSK